MNHASRTSQRGFSLVELMVVVAIIGILASIAIPSVNKYMAKARQSEAKTNLGSVYTAEKAFFTEYGTYDDRLQAVGFAPEGQLRYNVGFTDGGVNAGTANGFNSAANITATIVDALTYCAGVANTCSLLNGAGGAAPASLATTDCTVVANVNTAAGCTAGTAIFQAGAKANLVGASTNYDSWAINHQKLIRNTINGLN